MFTHSLRKCMCIIYPFKRIAFVFICENIRKTELAPGKYYHNTSDSVEIERKIIKTANFP